MRKDRKAVSFGKIFYFIKPYPGYIACLTVLIILVAVFEGVGIVTLFGLLGTILSPATMSTAGGVASFLFAFINMIPGNKIIAVSLIMISITLLKGLLVLGRQVFNAYAGYRIWYDIQRKIFIQYLNADYQFFLDNKQGQLIFKGYSAPSFMGCLLQYAGEVLALIFQIATIGFVLFSISPALSATVFLFGGGFYLLTNFMAKRVSYYLGKGRREASERQNVLLAEFISGIKQIKVFMSGERWLGEYIAAMKDYFRMALKDRVWNEIPQGAVEIFAITMFCVIVAAFERVNPQGFMSQLPVLGAFAYGFYRFMPAVKQLGILRMGIAGNLPMVEVVHSIAVRDINKIKDGTLELKDFEDRISFENIEFAYPGRSNTLSDINFAIRKGRVTAIVGPSGSGKTTVANLLLRIFVPDKGRILVDGLDLNDVRLGSWLAKIGYVSQDAFIFNASIEENIVFGRPYKRDRVTEAARLANAHSFIETFPDGYKTVVGDQGAKLSGGQRQRIAIARAIYHNPELLIFDEATSSLDSIQEANVQEAIRAVAERHTVVIVAHRFSTILDADWIIVLNDGIVVEQGTHASLTSRRDLYWRLYKEQHKEVIK